MEKLTAILSYIKHQNDGFLIADFKQPDMFFDKVFTVLGNFLTIKQGMTYEMIGKWKPNTYKGRTTKQFHIQSARIVTPSDTKGIYRYLVNVASFVGVAIGNRLVDRYGDKTLEILKSDPAKVASEIKGLTAARAEVIVEQLKENDEIESVMVELESLIGGQEGIPKKLISNLIQRFGMTAVEQLRRNPYILTEFPRIGFLSADRVAMEVFDIASDSVFRQSACVEHVISNIRREGNIWADESLVKIRVKNEINVRRVEEGIERLIGKAVIVRKGSFLAFAHDDENERLIAERVELMGQYLFETENEGVIDYDDI